MVSVFWNQIPERRHPGAGRDPLRRRQLFMLHNDLIVFADEIGESPAGHRSAGASLWIPAFAGMTKLNRATRDTCPRAKRVGRDSFSYEQSELLKLGWGEKQFLIRHRNRRRDMFLIYDCFLASDSRAPSSQCCATKQEIISPPSATCAKIRILSQCATYIFSYLHLVLSQTARCFQKPQNQHII